MAFSISESSQIYLNLLALYQCPKFALFGKTHLLSKSNIHAFFFNQLLAWSLGLLFLLVLSFKLLFSKGLSFFLLNTSHTNSHFHNQLIYHFIQTYYMYCILSSLSTFKLYSYYCTQISLFFTKLLSRFPLSLCSTPMQNCGLRWHLQITIFSFRGNLFSYTNLPHSISSTHTHLVLAVPTASHFLPVLTLSPRYVNSVTVST